MAEKNSHDGFTAGYCEYLVQVGVDKKSVIIRIVTVIAALALTLGLFVLARAIPQVLFIWFVVICFLVFAVFKMTSREFEYTVASGEMSVDVIYGKKFRRNLLNVKLSDATKVYPVENTNKKFDKTYVCCSKKTTFIYCMEYKDGENVNGLYFNDCKKLTDSIKYFNRSVITERK